MNVLAAMPAPHVQQNGIRGTRYTSALESRPGFAFLNLPMPVPKGRWHMHVSLSLHGIRNRRFLFRFCSPDSGTTNVELSTTVAIHVCI